MYGEETSPQRAVNSPVTYSLPPVALIAVVLDLMLIPLPNKPPRLIHQYVTENEQR
jgi:hypothetical protein